MSEEDERINSQLKMTEHVTIKCKSQKGGPTIACRHGEVLADGKPLGSVTAVDVRLDWNVDEMVRAKIEVIPDEIAIDAAGYPLTCRHDGQEYVMVPRDHWDRVQRRLDELREGESA